MSLLVSYIYFFFFFLLAIVAELVLFFLCFVYIFFLLIFFPVEEFFPDAPKSPHKNVDVGKMKNVALDPGTPVDGCEVGPSMNISDAVKRSLEFCHDKGISLDSFKFVGIRADKLRVMPKKSEIQLSRCLDEAFTVPDVELEISKKPHLETIDAGLSMMYKGTILMRGMRMSFEEKEKETALRERDLLLEIDSLKSQLAGKQRERDDAVSSYHVMEGKAIGALARVEEKEEECAKLQTENAKLKESLRHLEKKMLERDEDFIKKCDRIWELCFASYDKFGARSGDKCWSMGDYDSFFSWLCRQYEDLSAVIETTSDLSVFYSSRALFHLMKQSQDPLYDKICDSNYKFPEVASLTSVSRTTQVLCNKFLDQYWNGGGRKHCFDWAKEKLQKVCIRILLYCFFNIFV